MSSTDRSPVLTYPTVLPSIRCPVLTTRMALPGRLTLPTSRSTPLCAYEPPTRCPILTTRMLLLPVIAEPGRWFSWWAMRVQVPHSLLRACYAMSGTDIAYRGIAPVPCP
eukprot:3451114-Rhodomonas_salina.8